MNYRLVISTCPEEEAKNLVTRLLERRLIACANLIPAAESHYWWEGKIETARETLLFMKTRAEKADSLIAAIREIHSYDVPEVLVLPVEAGNPDYLKWVAAETAGADPEAS